MMISTAALLFVLYCIVLIDQVHYNQPVHCCQEGFCRCRPQTPKTAKTPLPGREREKWIRKVWALAGRGKSCRWGITRRNGEAGGGRGATHGGRRACGGGRDSA